jgi:prolyl oligopeptidase
MAAFNAPPTRVGTDVDEHHGESVPDPYRWLEDTDDPETRAWVERQNQTTESYLSTLPMRDAIRSHVAELWDYPKLGVPFERGGRWFQFRNSGLQNQPVLYVMERLGEDARQLLDPNVLSEDGTVAVTGAQVSHDGLRHERGRFRLAGLARARCRHGPRHRRHRRVVEVLRRLVAKGRVGLLLRGATSPSGRG